jgi:hypothetical protein
MKEAGDQYQGLKSMNHHHPRRVAARVPMAPSPNLPDTHQPERSLMTEEQEQQKIRHQMMAVMAELQEEWEERQFRPQNSSHLTRTHHELETLHLAGRRCRRCRLQEWEYRWNQRERILVHHHVKQWEQHRHHPQKNHHVGLQRIQESEEIEGAKQWKELRWYRHWEKSNIQSIQEHHAI